MSRAEQLAALTAITAAVAIAAPATANADCSPLEQQRYIQRNMNEHTHFLSRVVSDVHHPTAVIDVSLKNDPSDHWINPLPLVGEDGDIVAYVSRNPVHPSHIERLSADKTKVIEYIGKRAVAVRHPEQLISERVIHATRHPSERALGYVPDFRDAQGNVYGHNV